MLADPEGSILEPLINRNEIVEAGSWLVEGIGEDFIPDICEINLANKAYAISDKEALNTAREVLLQEGVMVGSSSGTLIAAALNGILSRGVEHYKDGPYSLDTPERIATLAIRIADATVEIANERLPRPRSASASPDRVHDGDDRQA